MAKQKVKMTIKKRERKTGGNSGYIKCNVCGGSGRIKDWHKKKK